ncbi:hypothetical protein ABZ807_17305 [Micromonospora sp. NPDC047548]|uniref:hypothetical protein n=1 Tax=Micromonospora sp. NPDC047548 TaxID=3155624 RepID=UPI0033E2535A
MRAALPVNLRHPSSGARSCLNLIGRRQQELAYWRDFTGRADLATTVMACLEHDAPILTGEHRYGDDDLPD